ncbi:MAG: diguanylate cyclase [Pirellulaceae bacterium]|nr:MAG: diguanylate cyclase [Pirellulaceae bacterium]
MTISPGTSELLSSAGAPAGTRPPSGLDDLWKELHESPAGQGGLTGQAEAYLVAKRLGVASSLYFSLRARHAPTAAHCLRVALCGSCWAAAAELPDAQRDALEIAALLHDVGKVGVPDHVLLKPGKLTADEQLVMSRYRLYTHEIVAACCASPDVLNILSHQGAWYDGSQPGQVECGKRLPLGARMLSILDAYDSMVTEHVYRRALTRERAIGELFACAGTQFDPELVEDFAALIEHNLLHFQAPMIRRWLRELEPSNMHGLLRDEPGRVDVRLLSTPAATDSLHEFHAQLLNSMHDGVFFVDTRLRILHWNRAVERITGIQARTVLECPFSPELIGMANEDGEPIPEERCPVAQVLASGSQKLQRVMVRGRGGRAFLVNLHIVPVSSAHGERKGAAVLLHDASSQVHLEERVQLLQERATRDPLTGVANRAELERVLPEFVASHQEQKIPCSLIICDIDHFKRINDIYGHQAGDEALKVFAEVLQSAAGPGELVARYGGEEFVLLLPNTDADRAVRLAEEIRRNAATRPIASMANQCLTASFGVTELQPGDTPDTMLRRADRALLQAKDAGRNRVVQLGCGWQDNLEEVPERRSWWSRLLSRGPADLLVTRRLVSEVPLCLAAEKLKGFIADHHAEILEVLGSKVRLRIDGMYVPLTRRKTDRPVPIEVVVHLEEQPLELGDRTSRMRTGIWVEVRPVRRRERRAADFEARARQLIASLRAYLMAEEAGADATASSPDDQSQDAAVP